MDCHDLIGGAGLPDEAFEVVCGYLSRLDAALPLPATERERIITEAADALLCETHARLRSGEQPSTAANTAVAEFGDPGVLAEQFAAALAPGLARRVGLMLIGSGPLVGLSWVAAIGGGAGAMSRIGSALAAMPVLPVILAFSVSAAAVAALAGRHAWRLNVRAEVAPRAARLAAFGCVCADAILIASSAGQLFSGRLGFGGWVAWATALSVCRLALAATALGRLRRLREAGC